MTVNYCAMCYTFSGIDFYISGAKFGGIHTQGSIGSKNSIGIIQSAPPMTLTGIGRALTHELGHGLSMFHDTPGTFDIFDINISLQDHLLRFTKFVKQCCGRMCSIVRSESELSRPREGSNFW